MWRVVQQPAAERIDWQSTPSHPAIREYVDLGGRADGLARRRHSAACLALACRSITSAACGSRAGCCGGTRRGCRAIRRASRRVCCCRGRRRPAATLATRVLFAVDPASPGRRKQLFARCICVVAARFPDHRKYLPLVSSKCQ